MNERASDAGNELLRALSELDAASEELSKAEEAYSNANGWTCRARNRVNAAQRTLDALVDRLKKKAPRDTDWKRPPIVPVGQ